MNLLKASEMKEIAFCKNIDKLQESTRQFKNTIAESIRNSAEHGGYKIKLEVPYILDIANLQPIIRELTKFGYTTKIEGSTLYTLTISWKKPT